MLRHGYSSAKLGSALLVSGFLILLILSQGCSKESAGSGPADSDCPTAPDSAPYECVEFAHGETPRVVMETTLGTMILELWPDVAYKHCQSFVYLANKGFYNSLTFHRVVPRFVIQGGDPDGNGTGGPGYTVPAEFSDSPHVEGTLSMARASDPNSAGSQFFVCLGRLAVLDGAYTVFGRLVDGYDVLRAIENVPTSRERPNTPIVMTRVFLEGG